MKLSIVTIGAFVAAMNQATKYIGNNFIKRDISKFIPICSVIYGILLALIGFFFVPDSEMGNDFIEAIIVGISAGSASTGLHQIGRQISKSNNSDESIASDEISTTLPEEEKVSDTLGSNETNE